MGDGLSEHEIHRAVVNQLRYRGVDGLTFWHTPNGAHYSAEGRWRQASKMDAYGALNGVSDLIIVHNGKNYALELKSESGKPSKAQTRFLMDMAANGWETGLAYGLDDAMALIEGWGLVK